jgi:hypothetical protein
MNGRGRRHSRAREEVTHLRSGDGHRVDGRVQRRLIREALRELMVLEEFEVA